MIYNELHGCCKKVRKTGDFWLVSKTALIVQNSEIDFPQDIQIYPNPFSENIWISVPQSYSPFQLEIYSLKGELLQVFNENQSEIKQDVSPGIYVLKITTPKGVYAQKLVKQ